LSGLQWGRVRSDAESMSAHSRLSPRGSLQWGRVRSDAESGLPCRLSWRPNSFNGAASDRTRSPLYLGLAASKPMRFNGAASDRTRSPIKETARQHLRRPLQWGRVRSDAESRRRLHARILAP